jgi:hypothetical protein
VTWHAKTATGQGSADQGLYDATARRIDREFHPTEISHSAIYAASTSLSRVLGIDAHSGDDSS